MSARLIEIFRAGTHITAAGQKITFSESDIALTAATFSPKRKPAPLVLGHPESDGPPMGETTRLVAKGARLFAFVEPFQELTYLVRSGAYKKISAAFHPPVSPTNPMPGTWYLRHIGFLGGVGPAVKGMQSPEFCEGLSVCFADPVEIEFPVEPLGLPAGYRSDPARMAVHNMALGYQRANPSLSYLEAVAFAESI